MNFALWNQWKCFNKWHQGLIKFKHLTAIHLFILWHSLTSFSKRLKEKTDLLAATALATVLGMAMGLSELELLMDLSHPDLLLLAPDLESPPGGPEMQCKDYVRVRCLNLCRGICSPSGYIHCRLGGVAPQSSQIPGIRRVSCKKSVL